MPKKRGSKNVLLIDFTAKSIGRIVKDINRTIQKSTGINEHITNIRKIFTNYEEPFCEIRQNHKGMKISIKLPEVKKKDIFLNVSQTSIEVNASSIARDESKKDILKVYHRIINIPECSISEKTTADYKRDKLKINVPYEKIK